MKTLEIETRFRVGESRQSNWKILLQTWHGKKSKQNTIPSIVPIVNSWEKMYFFFLIFSFMTSENGTTWILQYSIAKIGLCSFLINAFRRNVKKKKKLSLNQLCRLWRRKILVAIWHYVTLKGTLFINFTLISDFAL